MKIELAWDRNARGWGSVERERRARCSSSGSMGWRRASWARGELNVHADALDDDDPVEHMFIDHGAFDGINKAATWDPLLNIHVSLCRKWEYIRNHFLGSFFRFGLLWRYYERVRKVFSVVSDKLEKQLSKWQHTFARLWRGNGLKMSCHTYSRTAH